MDGNIHILSQFPNQVTTQVQPTIGQFHYYQSSANCWRGMCMASLLSMWKPTGHCLLPNGDCRQGSLTTVTALLSTTHNLLEAGREVCAIFFDFRKAFDSVPHRKLLDKLQDLGLDERILHSGSKAI